MTGGRVFPKLIFIKYLIKSFLSKTIKKQTHKLYMLISIFYRNNYSCMLIDVIDFLNAIHIHNQNIVFTPHNHYT